MKTIKKILENPYVGFLLLLKDLIEIIEFFLNLNPNLTQMNILINVIVDLFIGIVIYKLLKQYKLKADKIEVNEELSNHTLQLSNHDSQMNNLIRKHDSQMNNLILQMNNAIKNHALQINFLKSILASNNIRECDFDIARNELTENEMKENGFNEKDVINRNNLKISEVKPTIQNL
jgi:uncharacterized membrane-anchored protein YhcB (DUF1043 family)